MGRDEPSAGREPTGGKSEGKGKKAEEEKKITGGKGLGGDRKNDTGTAPINGSKKNSEHVESVVKGGLVNL